MMGRVVRVVSIFPARFIPGILLFIQFVSLLANPVPGESGRAWETPDRMEAPLPPVGSPASIQDRRDFALLRRALGRYGYIRQLGDDLRSEIQSIRSSVTLLDYSELWKLEESHQRIEKGARRVRKLYRQKMALELQGVLESLDQIQGASLRRDPSVVQFYRIVYRILAVFLTESADYAGAINALDHYLRYGGGEEEWPVHFFYSVNLDAMFAAARKNSGIGEADLRVLQKERNRHILRFLELKYGRNEKIYRETEAKFQMEESTSPF